MGGRVVVDYHCIVLRSNLGCNRFRMIRDDIVPLNMSVLLLHSATLAMD